MRKAYPVVFTQLADGYMAYVPDMDINTQGNDLAEAIEMARDAIGLVGIDLLDDGKSVPEARAIKAVAQKDGELVSMVDIDFDAYRRTHNQRVVRRNVTLPEWLNERANKEKINVSAVLQNALKKELNLE